MAMKGVMNNRGGGGGGGGGRRYGVMLLLAFAAAVVGVMTVHKMRDRRIYNILVKEKEREVLALNLRFQTEKENCRELKRRLEDIRTKLETLKSEKTEMSRQFYEMQDVTNSLRDKYRAVKSALEQKQGQIDTFRTVSSKRVPRRFRSQVKALQQALKDREAEIEDLKSRMNKEEEQQQQTPPIWSVSSDDPSKPQINNTVIIEQVGEKEEMLNPPPPSLDTKNEPDNQVKEDASSGKLEFLESKTENQTLPVSESIRNMETGSAEKNDTRLPEIRYEDLQNTTGTAQSEPNIENPETKSDEARRVDIEITNRDAENEPKVGNESQPKDEESTRANNKQEETLLQTVTTQQSGDVDINSEKFDDTVRMEREIAVETEESMETDDKEAHAEEANFGESKGRKEEDDDDDDGLEETSDDTSDHERRRDTEPENYQDDNDGEENH